jgi:putative transposase
LHPRQPYAKRPFLISCYAFKIVDGVLKIPIGDRRYFDIQLNSYVKNILSDPALQIRAFTLTTNTVSICYSKEVQPIEVHSLVGVDRNLRNLTVGYSENVIQYDLSKAIDIAANTRSIMGSFKRNDHRIRKKLYSKYGQRRKNRVNQLLHKVSEAIVQQAKEKKAAIVFEDIKNIRSLYQRGNYQLRDYRFKINSWPFHELKRQIEYKASWEGVPIVTLTKAETRGTSSLCPRCGKRTQVAARDDVQHKRQLWCESCKQWQDRDLVAAMNIARKGWLRFDHPQGAASEAMVQESGSVTPVILKVDVAKLGFRYKPET